MSIPEGDPKHCSLCAVRACIGRELEGLAGKHATFEDRPLTRDEKIDWALGNLNASTNHRTTRAAVEAAYDRIHPEERR